MIDADKNLWGVFLIISFVVAIASCTENNESSVIAPELIYHTNEFYIEKEYPFSEAVEVGGWVFLSGSIGIDPKTNKLVKGGIQAEARQAMDNIQASLLNMGLGMNRIVKCIVMIDDMADWPVFNLIYKTYFDGRYPARSALGVDGLALGATVEVECLAHR